MTILVIINKPLTTTSNGYDLRVWHLCNALARHERLILFTLSLCPSNDIAIDADIQPEKLFSEVLVADPVPTSGASVKRHFRLREDRFFCWGYPAFQQSIIAQIEAICSEHGIEKIIAFGSDLAGFVKAFAGKKKILLDVCDSVALTLERQMAPAQVRFNLREMLRLKLMYQRWQALEGRIPAWCDHVVTINHSDTEKVRQLSGGKTNLSTIPNGVAPELEYSYQEGPCKRYGVAFWGNLSFDPNKDALKFFHKEVYLPYLKPAGIELCVIGRDPEPWLLDAASQDAKLRLTGFVKDMRELLAEYPIMVNPMRIGSGMKNKVLEAYAMGLAVVSTPLGIESIEGAVAGQNYMEARTAPQFFDAILALLNDEEMRLRVLRSAHSLVLEKYTWDIVGARWQGLVASL